jgi:hypothetical protein
MREIIAQYHYRFLVSAHGSVGAAVEDLVTGSDAYDAILDHVAATDRLASALKSRPTRWTTGNATSHMPSEASRNTSMVPSRCS